MEQAALRAKAGGQSGTYFEWRTPSASANPYLVLAGIVAAGLDGIKNEILPVSTGEILLTSLHDESTSSLYGTQWCLACRTGCLSDV